MKKGDKIFVAGHTGLVGSAIIRKLRLEGYMNILTASSKDLDLRDQSATNAFFEEHKPQYVFLCAGKVGGIFANNFQRAVFIYDNLAIQVNVIHAAYLHHTEKLLALGSSCIYPKNCPQPIKEKYLLTGELEPTNEPYAISKIAALKMCDAYRNSYECNFISAMPTNLYGPGDNYHTLNSHVLPALIKKFCEDETVSIWGSGKPRREFMHVDDLADAALFLMLNYNEPGHVNVGTGEDISISEVAEMIKEITGFEGEVNYDDSKPDGMMVKRLDVSKINSLGWKAKISLKEGLERTIKEYKIKTS